MPKLSEFKIQATQPWYIWRYDITKRDPKQQPIHLKYTTPAIKPKQPLDQCWEMRKHKTRETIVKEPPFAVFIS